MTERNLSRKDRAFVGDMHQTLMTESARPGLWLTVIGVGMLGVAVMWAALSEVEEITQGQAKVISASKEQIIQSLEGGIVARMLVAEGQEVESGQPLLQLDPTRAQAGVEESEAKINGLKGAAARLRSESTGVALSFPAGLPVRVVEMERRTYVSRRQALEQGVAAVKRSLGAVERERAIMAPLVSKGLASEVELSRLQSRMADLEREISDRQNKYRSDAAAELSKIEAELGQASAISAAREDQQERTLIRSPMRATVKNIRVTTIGAVVAPGGDILELVPRDERLVIEAKIRPQDVAFLRPGLPALVKVTAYDYSIYGGLAGVVESISPDAIQEEKRTVPTPEESYYRVKVRTEKAVLEKEGRKWPIIPGMQAGVEIRTGQKSVLSYLLKPFFKAREALRER